VPAAMTDAAVAELRLRLAQIRAEGYALSFGEFRPGINSLAAPVWNAEGKAIASIVVNGSSERLTPERLQLLAPDVVAAASRVSETLGYRPI